MSIERERHWQAYLDGELSASEASEFEESLSAGERERVAAELRFESALADALGQDAACPDLLWKRSVAMLREGRAPRRARRRWAWGAGTLAAAVAVAFVVSVLAPVNRALSPAVVLAAESIEELAAMSETAAGLDPVQRYLNRHGAKVELSPLDSLAIAEAHHGIVLLGARSQSAAGEPVIEMLLGCCGYPVKVVMAERGSDAAAEIGRSAAGGPGQVQSTRVVGDYVAAVVGDHPAHGLLDIFGEKHSS